MQTCPSPHPASSNKSLGPTSARSKAFHLGARINTDKQVTIRVPSVSISDHHSHHVISYISFSPVSQRFSISIILKPAALHVDTAPTDPDLLHCLRGSPHKRPNGPGCSLHGTWKLRSMDFTLAKLVTKQLKKMCHSCARLHREGFGCSFILLSLVNCSQVRDSKPT